MLSSEPSSGRASRRSTRRWLLAGLMSVAGAGLGVTASAQVATPKKDAAKATERLVFSLPNGQRVERDVPRGSLDKLPSAGSRRVERPIASSNDGQGMVVPGPGRAAGAAVGAASGMTAGGMKSGKGGGGGGGGGGSATASAGRGGKGTSAGAGRGTEGGVAASAAPATTMLASDSGLDGVAKVLGWVPDRLGGGRYSESQPTRIPQKPTNVRASDNGAGGVELSWISASSNQAAFMIERVPPFADSLPRFAGPGQVVWVDESGPGTYSYQISAINEDARSAPTDPVEVTVGSNTASTPVLMVPGIGWAGETPDPAAAGSSGQRGFDAKAIARFDVVPNMTVDGHVDVGVVAFHIAGIQRVDFAVEGGPWSSVTQMTLNAQTGVWEYSARVQASDFTGGGPVEVRAIAYPNVGEPRVLTVTLYVPRAEDGPTINMFVSPLGNDTTGTGTRENPYRSMNKAAKEIEIRQNGRADGGVINLLQGDYQWGPAGRDAEGRWISYPMTEQRFLTIQPAPGLGKRDVRIVEAPGGGLRTKLIHLRNVTVVGCQLDNAQPPNSDRAVIWIHGCTFTGPSIISAVRWVSPEQYLGGVFVTNTVVRDSAEGWSGVTMLRGCTIDAIGDDAFVNCEMVVNCEARNIINPDGTGFHSDVLQYHTQTVPMENIIVYNLRAVNNESQAWNVGYTHRGTGPTWSNMAFVNVVIEQSPNGFSSSWAADVNHLLWWNMTIPVGFVFLIDHPDVQDGVYFPTRLQNFSVRGCVFHKFNLSVTSGVPTLSDPTWADNNHFIDVTSHGTMSAGTRVSTGGTLGDLFADPVGNDFSARLNSALCNREGSPLLPNDSLGRRTAAFRAVGAMQPLQP